MNIGDAITTIETGALAARREIWPTSVYICRNKDADPAFLISRVDERCSPSAAAWTPTTSDLTAKDWVAVHLDSKVRETGFIYELAVRTDRIDDLVSLVNTAIAAGVKDMSYLLEARKTPVGTIGLRVRATEYVSLEQAASEIRGLVASLARDL